MRFQFIDSVHVTRSLALCTDLSYRVGGLVAVIVLCSPVDRFPEGLLCPELSHPGAETKAVEAGKVVPGVVSSRQRESCIQLRP